MSHLLWGYWVSETALYDITWTMPHCILTLRLIGLVRPLFHNTSISASNFALLNKHDSREPHRGIGKGIPAYLGLTPLSNATLPTNLFSVHRLWCLVVVSPVRDEDRPVGQAKLCRVPKQTL